MTLVLTPSQTFLLRRLSDGIALPAYLLRPTHSAVDVESLCAIGLLGAKAGVLTITPEGLTHLQGADAARSDGNFRTMRIRHEQDESITVEWRT